MAYQHCLPLAIALLKSTSTTNDLPNYYNDSPIDKYNRLDFDITDLIHLPNSCCPKCLQSIAHPRDLLAIVLLAVGADLSYNNVL
eukprot:14002323-Ditylum_brightwellii.AAC.1